MKRLAKAGLATTFALGTFAAVNTTDLAIDAEASEMTQETGEAADYYYYYEGYTGYNNDGIFLVDQTFVNALADNNFTLNGYEIDADPDAHSDSEEHETVEVYDQTLSVNEDGVATQAEFPVNDGVVSASDLERVYGEHVGNSSLDDEGSGMYHYFVNGNQITFSVTDNYVTHVNVGALDLTDEGDE